MKFCPDCRESYSDSEEICPKDRQRLLAIATSTEPNYAALVGQTLDGRYHLDELIGEGGMGVVYAAHHTILSKRVAIKVLKREVARDASVVKRFIQEAKAASTIGHANIVDVHDFGVLPDGHSYFVMDFVNGPTLSRVMRDGVMPAARALPIVAQLARALASAHDKGIVHRDLKPENIFLVAFAGVVDVVKIVDFGIAQMAPEEGKTRLTRAGMVFGTPEYMAPEQAAGKEIDHRVDIWALGVILFEMVTGTVPFKSESVMGTLAKVIMDPVPRPSEFVPGIHPELEAVIVNATAKDRDLRYGDMRSFAMALDECAQKLGLGAALGFGGNSAVMGIAASPSAMGISAHKSDPGSGLNRAIGGPVRQIDRTTPMGLRALPGGHRPTPLTTETPAHRSRKGVAIGVVAGVAAVTALAAVLLRSKGESSAKVVVDAAIVRPVDAAIVQVDAAVVAATEPDAGALIDAAVDSALIAQKVDAHVAVIPHDENVRITIVTDPPNGLIFGGGISPAHGETSVMRKKGSKLSVQCSKQPAWKNGSVSITVKRTETITCKLKPLPCEPGMLDPAGNPCPGP